MADVRTYAELDGFIERELAWRKHELQTLKVLQKRSRPHQRNLSARTAIMLYYSHWEGFVRKAGDAYLRYVESRRLPLKKLAANFVAVALRSELQSAMTTKSCTRVTTAVRLLLQGRRSTELFTWTGQIDAHNNLTSEVFVEIMDLLGLECAPYSIYFQFFDRKLVSRRNAVAHGDRVVPDDGLLDECARFLPALLDRFGTDVRNAASTKQYEESSP